MMALPPLPFPSVTAAGVVSAASGTDTTVVGVASGVGTSEVVLSNTLDTELGRPKLVAMVSVSETDELRMLELDRVDETDELKLKLELELKLKVELDEMIDVTSVVWDVG